MVFAKAQDPNKLVAEAQAAHRAGQLDAAAQGYRLALTAAPRHAGALYGMAAIESARRKPEAAIDFLERAAAAAPGELRILVDLGRLLNEVGRFDAALAALERAAALAPTSGDVAMARGVALAKLRRYPEAAATFRALTRAAPNEPGLWLNLGNALMQCDDAPGAIEAFRKAAALKPEDAGPVYALGRALLMSGAYEESLAPLARGMERAPHRLEIVSCKILALRHLGRHEAADELEGLDDLILEVEVAAPAEFGDLAGFNAALAAEIQAHPRLEHDVEGRATRNGAKLLDMFAREPSALFGQFERQTRQAFEATLARMPRLQGHPLPREIGAEGYGMDMWANVMYRGGHELAHNHVTGWFSGCYYTVTPAAVDASGAANEGWIEFGGAAYGLPEPADAPKRRMRPEPGLMIVFPSYVFHRTIPFDSDEIRISCAFDAKRPEWERLRRS